MLYQVIHMETSELRTLMAKDILDMDYDSEGRIIVNAKDHQSYFLLANKELISELQ